MAGQVATSIENARLYRELHLKAAEFDRLRVFNEHILESLDDGLLVVGGDGAVVRWNHALERIYGLRRGEAVGRGLDVLFEPAVVAAVQAARAASPNGGTEYRVPLAGRGPQSGSRLLVNVTTVPLLAHARPRVGRDHRHVRGRDRARASRGAAARIRADGLARPARRRRRPRSQHAADRHLQLHPDVARTSRSRRPERPSSSRRSSGRRSARRASSTACSTCRGRTRVEDGRPDRGRSEPGHYGRRAVAARAPVRQGARPGPPRTGGNAGQSSRATSSSCSRCSSTSS